MKPSRKFLFAAGIFAAIFLASTNLFAAHFYIAQNAAGASSGAGCTDAYAVTWFNISGNWANPKQTGKIGPGDTVHLCGTISVALTVPISGSAGNPITIYWEPNSKLSAAALNGNWISAPNKSYLTFDGGQNGIIENTDCGSGASYGGTYNNQVNTSGIVNANPGGINITVTNLTIQNLYVRTPYTMDPNQYGVGLYLGGSNISIFNVIVRNAMTGMAFMLPNGGSMTTIDSSTVMGANHCYEFALPSGNYSGITISNSVADGMDIWEQSSVSPDLGFHRDGIFFHTDYAISNVYLYNNRIGPGLNPKSTVAGTAAIYFDNNVGGCPDYTNLYVFNNLILLRSPLAWSGVIGSSYIGGCSTTGGGLVSNNTMVSNGGANNIDIVQANSSVYNNITYYAPGLNYVFGMAAQGWMGGGADPRTENIKIDCNIYTNAYGFLAYAANRSSFVCDAWTLAQWKNCTNGYFPTWDVNSSTVDPIFVNSSPIVGTGDYHLQAGSPAIAHGLNLASFAAEITNKDNTPMGHAAAAALLKDYAGKPRPSSGSCTCSGGLCSGSGCWDIGAYQYQEPLRTLSPPGGLHLDQ